MATAVVVAAITPKGGRKGSLLKNDAPFQPVVTLPLEMKMDVVLGTLLNGEWQKRRVCFNKSKLYFALVGDDQERDHVPLEEITAVEVMGEGKEIEELLTTVREAKRRKSLLLSTERRESLDTSLNFMYMNVFQVRTIHDGYNSGRTYYLQADSKESCDLVARDLAQCSKNARAIAEGRDRFRRSQQIARSIFKSIPFQILSACLIVANFATSVSEAQINVILNPDPVKEATIDKLELFFVLMFTAELAFNAYSHWMRDFFVNGWSLFDIVIVVLSLVGLFPLGLPLNIVLLFRSIRVLRIFGKVGAVNAIFCALFYSIVPITNAFFIIFVISSIYSIVGVTFYCDDAPAEFGSFARAFMAMFRVMAGNVDWWFDYFPPVTADGYVAMWPSAFIITYVVLVNWVFFQVCMAVLIDNFLAASATLKAERKMQAIRERRVEKQFKNPLDPLLLRLSKDYINDADLSARLQQLFKVLDSDGSGDLTSQEFQAAIKKLDLTPRIFMSDSDFIAMTANGALCDGGGHLRAEEFETVMREQLRLYAQTRLSSGSEFWAAATDHEFTPVAALKQILLEQLRLRDAHEAARRDVRDVRSYLQSGARSNSAPPPTPSATAGSEIGSCGDGGNDRLGAVGGSSGRSRRGSDSQGFIGGDGGQARLEALVERAKEEIITSVTSCRAELRDAIELAGRLITPRRQRRGLRGGGGRPGVRLAAIGQSRGVGLVGGGGQGRGRSKSSDEPVSGAQATTVELDTKGGEPLLRSSDGAGGAGSAGGRYERGVGSRTGAAMVGGSAGGSITATGDVAIELSTPATNLVASGSESNGVGEANTQGSPSDNAWRQRNGASESPVALGLTMRNMSKPSGGGVRGRRLGDGWGFPGGNSVGEGSGGIARRRRGRSSERWKEPAVRPRRSVSTDSGSVAERDGGCGTIVTPMGGSDGALQLLPRVKMRPPPLVRIMSTGSEAGGVGLESWRPNASTQLRSAVAPATLRETGPRNASGETAGGGGDYHVISQIVLCDERYASGPNGAAGDAQRGGTMGGRHVAWDLTPQSVRATADGSDGDGEGRGDDFADGTTRRAAWYQPVLSALNLGGVRAGQTGQL